MSSIDNRIVHMQFDNAKFESGVSKTMSTLQKLKESLNFKNKKTGLDGISEAAKKVDLSTIQDGLNTVEKRFSTFGIIGTTVLQNLTNSAVNTGKGIVKSLLGGITQGGIKRAFNIEQAKFTIEGLGKSFRKLRGDINYAVEGTAYGFDEAAKAASAMSASGIKAGSEMRTALRSVSGMAAMTGSSYSDIADIFTTVAGNGRVLSMQLNQLSSRGVNAAAVLTDYLNANESARKSVIKMGLASKQAKKVEEFANATKLTEQNVRTLVSSSAIDFKTFSKAMDDAFGEHAKAANKTFTGAMSNIKASLARMGEKFVLPAIQTNDKDAMLLQVYKEVDDKLIKISKDAVNAADSNASLKSKFLDSVGTIKKYSGKSEKEITKLVTSGNKEFFKSIKKLDGYSNKTSKEIKSIFKTQKDEFIARAKELPQYAEKSDKQLEKLYNRYKGVQFNLVTILQAVKRVFGVLESAISNSSFLQVFLTTLDKVSKALSYFLNAVAATFSKVEDSSGKLKNAIEVIGKKSHLIEANKLWESFRKTVGLGERDFNNLKDTVKGVFSVFDLLGEIVKEVINTLSPTGSIVKSFGSVLVSVTGAIGRFITATVKLIKKSKILKVIFTPLRVAFQAIAKVIHIVAEGVANLLTTISNNAALEKFVNVLGDLFDAFWNLISALGEVGKRILNFVLAPFQKLFDSLPSGGNLLTNIFSKLTPLVQTFTKALNSGAKYIRNFLHTDGFKSFGDIASEAFKKVTGFAETLWNKIKGFSIGSIFSVDKASASTGEIESEANQTKSILEKFLDFITNIKDKIKEQLEKLKKTIEKLDINPEKIGKAIVKGFTNVIKFIGGASFILLSAVGNALKSAFEHIAEYLPEPNSIGIMLGDFLAKAFQFLLSTIPTLVRIFATAIATFVSHLPSMIKDLGKQLQNILSEVLISGFEGGVNGTNRKIPGILSGIISAFRSALSWIANQLNNITLDDIMNALNKGMFARLLKKLGDFFGSKGKVNKSFGGLVKSAGKTLESIPKTLENVTKNMALFGTDYIGDKFVDRLTAISKAIMSFAKAVAILVGALVVLSYIPQDKLKQGGEALAGLATGVVIMAGALAIFNKIGGGNLQKLEVSFGALAGGLAALMVALFLISNLKDPGKAASTLMSILFVLGAFITAIDKLVVDPSKFSKITGSIIKFSVGIDILSIALKRVAGIDTGRLIKALLALTTVFGLFVGMSKLLEGSKASITGMLPMLLLMAGALGVVWIIAKMKLDTEPLLNIGKALLALSAVCLIMSKIPVPAAIGALASLGIFLGGLTALMAVLGAINKIPGLREFVDSGGELLLAVGKALGKFIGGIAGGIGEGMTSSLPKMAEDITDFVDKIKPLFDAASKIDKSIVSNIKNIADAILALCNANLKDSMAGFIGGGNNTDQFAEQVSALVDVLVGEGGLLSKTANIDKSQLKNLTLVTKAMKALAEMADAIPNEGGLAAGIFGDNTLSQFAAHFGSFAEEFSKMAGTLKDVPEDAISKIKQVAKAAQTIASLDIPNEGGFISYIVGDNTLSQFADHFGPFAEGFAGMIGSLQDVPEDGIAKVKNVAKATQEIASLELPNEGGFVSWFTGDNKLSDFAEEMGAFGQKFEEMLGSLSGVDEAGIDKVAAITKVVSVFSGIDMKNTSGIKTLQTIAPVLPGIGKNLKAYCDNLKGVDISGAKSVNKIADGLKTIGSLKISKNLGSSISSVGDGVKSYAKSLSGIKSAGLNKAASSISSSMKKIKSAVTKNDLNKAFKKSGTNAVKQFAKALSSGGKSASSAAKKMVTATAKAMSGATKKLAKPGEDGAEKFVDAIKKKNKSAEAAGKKLVSKAADGAKTSRSKFVSAGESVSEGYAQGVKNKSGLVYSAVVNLVQEAYRRGKKAQKSKSPSKIYKGLGEWAGEGYANGIIATASTVKAAVSYIIGEGADTTKELSSAFGSIFNDDISDPVIHPVLDLSDIQDGADNISSLLNSDYAMKMAGSMNVQSATLQAQENQISSTDISKLAEAMEESKLDPNLVYQAIKEGATNATTNLVLNGRELTRGLKDLGVAFK